MPYEFYKVMHVLGIITVFMSLGGLLLFNGTPNEKKGPRRWALISHGVGILLILIAGFGLMARLGMITGWPPWIWGKLAIWLVLAGGVALTRPQLKIKALPLWIGFLLLGGVAAVLAVYKVAA